MVKEFTIGCSRTVNLGNFESVRIEASITVITDIEYSQELTGDAQKELRKLMEDTYRHQYLDRKKLA